jgi:hypothetical protein
MKELVTVEVGEEKACRGCAFGSIIERANVQ